MQGVIKLHTNSIYNEYIICNILYKIHMQYFTQTLYLLCVNSVKSLFAIIQI